MDDKLDKPVKTEKPWGYELLWAKTTKYAGKILFVKQGKRLSLQFHRLKDESIYVFSGKIIIQIGNADGQLVSREMNPGDCVRIEPMTHHRIEATEDTYLFEVSTPELEDVVRLCDDFNRV